MGVDFSRIKKVYVIGITGSGVIGIVQFLRSMGIEVNGSDTSEKFFTDKILQSLGIKRFEKFSLENVPLDADLIIYSTAYNTENNIEFSLCERSGFPMMSYPEILGELFNQKYGIAVCGTHGKTTTSALLASVLKEIDMDPSAVIGSKVVEWGGNALIGKSEFFVIEADEFQNKLRLYEPKAAILTSADWDHPDFFPTFEEYKKAFADFVAKIPKTGFLVVWGDSVATNEIACNAKCEIIKYGFAEDNDIIVKKVKHELANGENRNLFSLSFSGLDLGEFETQLVGDHNLLNAASVIGVCMKLGLDMEKVREALKTFRGTARRFEYIGERNGAILIDDYGHHPEEIMATLKATREIYPEKNIIAVFHPHSFSRTEAFLQDFAQSFDSADKVLVLDIYGSARENSGAVSSEDLVKLINKYNRGRAEYVPTIDEAYEFLKDKIGAEDLVIAIGAGNVFEVVEKLKEK